MNTRIQIRHIAFLSILLIGSGILSSRANVVTDQLVAYFPFNNNALDASGNGHDGTVNGAQLTEDRFGNANSAYLFDGIDDYIEVLDSPDLRLNQTDFSFSSWSRNMAPSEGHNVILAKRGPEYSDGWFHSLQTVDSDSVRPYYIVSGGHLDPRVFTHESVQTNTWVHTVVTYELALQKLSFYIDGEFISEHSNIPSPNAATSENLTIGKDSKSALYCFNGTIDDICIYDKALSAQEVNALYTAIPEPASLGLLGIISGGIYFTRRLFF